MAPERVTVALGERSYDILVGPELLQQAGPVLRAVLRHPRVFVIADERVAALHFDHLAAALDGAEIAWQRLTVPPGEGSKSLATLEDLLDRLLALRIGRRDAIIALGGGVVGDLAGFAAATVLRGVDFVQIPTTLLAQVDSSVGGKTGVNSRHGKNLIGAFHQPRLVLADSRVLETLPRRELLAGYAETVKYGLIRDAAFFDWLEAKGEALVSGQDPAALREAVARACRAKAAVVAADEREAGQRALLNLGHTFGHAFEAEAGYDGRLLHGEGVALGMVLAFELSRRMGLCPGQDALRVRRHLTRVGLPTDLAGLSTAGWSSERLLDHMSRDKKVTDGRITFVLARRIGEAFLESAVDPRRPARPPERGPGSLTVPSPDATRKPSDTVLPWNSS